MDKLAQAAAAVRYLLENTAVPMTRSNQGDFRAAVWRLLVAVEALAEEMEANHD